MIGRDLLARWFVQYNPFTFASALCILAGVYVTADALPPDAHASKMSIVATMEFYQLLLILMARVLDRWGRHRTAAMLGLVAFVLVLDVALSGERILSQAGTMSLAPGMRARWVVPVSLAFAFLVPVKLLLILRVFGIRARTPLAVIGAMGGLLPLLPYLIEAAGPGAGDRQEIHLALFWMGAPLFCWALSPGARAWGARFTDPRVRRIAAVLPLVATLGFVIHATAWAGFPGVSLGPGHLAPYVLAGILPLSNTLARRSPRLAMAAAWTGVAASAALALPGPALAGVPAAPLLLLVAGPALLHLRHRARLPLLLPAALSLFAGVVGILGGTELRVADLGTVSGLLSIILVLGAMRDRDLHCLAGSALAFGLAVISPSPRFLLLHGILVATLWLGLWAWVIFPELRRGMTLVVLTLLLGVGGVLAWVEPASFAPWYAGVCIVSVIAGFVQRQGLCTLEGIAGAVHLSLITRRWWIPDTALEWGVLLLAAGFLFLGAGVVSSLLLGRRDRLRATAA